MKNGERWLVCVKQANGYWEPDLPATTNYRVARQVVRDFEDHWARPKQCIILDLEHWAGVENAIVYGSGK